jgi:hypothetical protein
VGGLSGGIRAGGIRERAFWQDTGEEKESSSYGQREPKPASLGQATLNKASLGGENLNKLPLGRENSNKIMRAGKPLKIKAFFGLP